MDINIPPTYFENLKRYCKRRRYQRLGDDTATTIIKKKLKITRLGSKSNRRRVWKIRLMIPKIQCKIKIVSPIKLLAKLHDAYVDMMTHLVVDNDNNNVVLFGGKRVQTPRGRPAIPLMVSAIATASDYDSACDGRLVMQIYKRLESSGELLS